MKIISLVCLLVVGAAASTHVVRNVIPILRYNQEIRGGLFDSTSFETGNGIQSSETTKVVAGNESSYEGENGQLIKSDSSLVRSGSYSYIALDGTSISVSWTADENGFRATGAHFPTPIPAESRTASALRLTRGS